MKRLGLVVLGCYVCVVGAVVHRHSGDLGGVEWPWGLLIAVVATFAATVGASHVQAVGGAWFGVGWAVALVGQQFSPGGGYLVPSDMLGWSFVVAGLGSVVAGVALAPRLTT